MKIFSWVQNKLTSRKSNSIPANHQIQQLCKEEFSDWPHGLLAIGTFGNNIKQEEDQKANLQENFPPALDDLHGLLPEEVGKIQKDHLNSIFHEHAESTSANLDPSTEAEARNCSAFSDDSKNRNDNLQCSTSLVHGRERSDICMDNSSKAAIGKKSLSFLLKKMFVCRSGFSSAPTLRDPIMESRMEKMLRTMLHKKIYPQSSSSKLSTKKSLERGHIPKTAHGNEQVEKADNGSKWVKTDSEYIVLEI